jgi:hypothetical protein
MSNFHSTFDWVTMEEDPICYGIEWITDQRSSETHCFIEMKEEKSDSFASPRPGSGTFTQVRTPGMGSIPEEVSVDRSSYSNEAGTPYGVGTPSGRSVGRSVGSVGSRGTRRDMSICSDDYSNDTDGLDEYIQDCERELLGAINNRARDASISVTSDYSDASKMKSPPKKQRHVPESATMPTVPGNQNMFASMDNRKPPPQSAKQSMSASMDDQKMPARTANLFRSPPIVTTVDSFSTCPQQPSPSSAHSVVSTRSKRKTTGGKTPRYPEAVAAAAAAAAAGSGFAQAGGAVSE